MFTAIVAAEVAFWVLLLLGLVSRYVLHRRRLSAALLVATPLVDLLLLGMVLADLAGGARAEFLHGMSALYIGFSITHGPRTIRWADAWAAHRWDGAPRPQKAQRSPAERLAHQWSEWRRACGASAIVLAINLLAIAISASGEVFWLLYWAVVAVWVPLSWLVVGPLRTSWKVRRSAGQRQGDLVHH